MSHFATHGLIEMFKIGWPYLWVVWPFLTYAMTKDGKPELVVALTALAIVGVWFFQSDHAWLSSGFVAGALAYAAPAWIGAWIGVRHARNHARAAGLRAAAQPTTESILAERAPTVSPRRRGLSR
jgi:uncharacterized membrane protein YfcA